MTELIWSFAPWIVFLLTARLTNVGVAIGAGAIAAVVVLVRAVANRRVHLLDVASLGYFAGLATLVVVTQPSRLDQWAAYAQAGSHLVLMVVVWGSILIGKPFTEAYARQTTPAARSSDPAMALNFTSMKPSLMLVSFFRSSGKVARPDCLTTFAFDGAVSSLSTVHFGLPDPVSVAVHPSGAEPV